MTDKPMMMPLGTEISAEDVHGVWDVFVKPTQSDDARPQSVEDRALMAILRWTHDKLSSGPCEGCLR